MRNIGFFVEFMTFIVLFNRLVYNIFLYNITIGRSRPRIDDKLDNFSNQIVNFPFLWLSRSISSRLLFVVFHYSVNKLSLSMFTFYWQNWHSYTSGTNTVRTTKLRGSTTKIDIPYNMPIHINRYLTSRFSIIIISN